MFFRPPTSHQKTFDEVNPITNKPTIDWGMIYSTQNDANLGLVTMTFYVNTESKLTTSKTYQPIWVQKNHLQMWNVVTQYSIHWWLLLFKPKLVGGLCTQENIQLQRNWLTPENARKPNVSLFLVKSPLLIWQRQPIFTWQNQILKAVECHFSRLHCCWWNTR